MTRALLFSLSLAICLTSIFELNRRYQASQYLILESNPLKQAESLLTENRWQEAKYLAEFIRANPHLGDEVRAHSIILAADTALDYLPLQIKAFLGGAMSGEAYNSASLLGAVSLDLFVIGDVRDILVQGYKQLTEQNGDKVILALSASGLSLTLLPQFHWAPSILKGMKRTNTLSKPFSNLLKVNARIALRTGDFRPLAKLITHFGRMIEKLGIGPSKGAMQAVYTQADLMKLARAAALEPQQSYAIAALAGNRGIKRLEFSGKNVNKVAAKFKYASRLAKVAKKSFGSLPLILVLTIWLLSLVSLVYCRPFLRQ